MRDALRVEGWRGVVLIATTYFYFLIFAQFGFLNRLAALHISDVKMVMAAMALGGVLLSLVAPRTKWIASPALRLQIGFGVAAWAALLALAPLNQLAAAAVGFLLGSALGLLTVTVVTHLRDWTGSRNPILKVAFGTGIAYFFSNIPAIFTAAPERQAILAALLCAVGLSVTIRPPSSSLAPAPLAPPGTISFARALASFAALVWLDSAAFYIIQHSPVLRAGTWTGDVHLWTTAFLHLMAAVAAGFLLQRGKLSSTLAGAFAALAFACVLLLNPAHAPSASLFYPVGVSLYSVGLVAYPSLLTTANSPTERARQAGWIYAIAGWIGSALGIGMGQNLGRVPLLFVAGAGAVVLFLSLPRLLQSRVREAALLCLTAGAAFILYRLSPASSVIQNPPPVERGKQVYISEGCISCHSQYVRPNTTDVAMWGPVESLQAVHAQRPPLIGNRRQGPDLSEVGARRSPLWLKAHLIDPAQVSVASIMPSFAFLFRDRRGDDLVAYLASLQSAGVRHHIAEETAWNPDASASARASLTLGERLYRQDCATCHDSDGETRRQWQSGFKQLPTNLFNGPFTYLPPQNSTPARAARLAQIAKFGIPGTDMPGHEYLSDYQIASLTLWLTQHSAQPLSDSKTGDDR